MTIDGDIEKGLQAALNGTALLFTGAGFSFGAKNANGSDITGGRQLAKELAARCGITDELELDVASQFFQEDHGDDELIRFIRPKYTVSDVAGHHLELAAVPWRRVYTTNYDNVYEFACSRVSRDVQPIVTNTPPNAIVLSSNDCVHINGSILTLNRDTLHTSFKLTRASYLTDAFTANPWEHVFRSDVECAESVFFIGYSLYDLDISRILFGTEKLQAKTFFVVSTTPTSAEKRLFSPFGSLAPIGVNGFAAYVSKAKKSFVPRATNEIPLASFDTFLEPSHKPLDIRHTDIFNLLFYGDVNPDFVAESLRSSIPDYTIRRKAIDELTSTIGSGAANIIVHSDLGNGKSVLIEQLRSWAHSEARSIFVYRKRTQTTQREIQQICNTIPRPIFVFENYEYCLDFVKETQTRRPSTSVVILTSRSGVHDIFYRDVSDILGEYIELDANVLRPEDIEQLSAFLTTHGMWGDFADLGTFDKARFIRDECGATLHAVLLKLLASKTIHDRLNEAIAQVQENPDLYRMVISVLILQVLNIQIDGNLLLDMLGSDAQATLRRNAKSVSPFIDVKTGSLRARSAILGEFVLSNVADAAVVLDALIRMTERASEKAKFTFSKSIYRDIRKGLIRFSNLQAMLPAAGKRQSIIRYYESVKSIRDLQEDPHFWLQYAVARITLDDLNEAGQYFKTSYALCRRRPGYDTSFIDNHFARFLILDAIAGNEPTRAIEAFKEAALIVTGQAKKTTNRHYPFRVGGMFADFFEHYQSRLTIADMQLVSDRAQDVYEEIPKLPPRIQSHFSVKECKAKLGGLLRQLEAIGISQKKSK